MKEATYVTEVAQEENYPDRHVNLPFANPPMFPLLLLNERVEWEKENGWKLNYSVPREKLEEAKELAAELAKTDYAGQEKIIKRLLEIRSIPWEKKTDQQKWNHMAVQMPGDWGPASWAKKRELKDLVTKQCYGRVLEPMCGFRSYIGESPEISEVVAIDFSIEALKRYDHPERKRILYNLEDVVNGDKMEFFGDESFQNVTAFFAIDYLTNPVPVHKEFKRMLSKGGQLLVVDGPAQGYMDIKKRKFNPQVCANSMEAAGFSTEIFPLPSIKLDFEREGYFLVKGKK